MATDDKYGRQLRLWGANGQAALMGAHVLLLGAEPTGSETLKNLVLPGLGLVAVVDGGDVTASDLASNFFVEPAALGRKRADVDVQLLCEMNPDGPRAAVDPAALSRPSRRSSPAAATPPPLPYRTGTTRHRPVARGHRTTSEVGNRRPIALGAYSTREEGRVAG